jgi:hypothetical protein
MTTIDFANSAIDLFRSTCEALNHIGVVLHRDPESRTARARVKRGVGASWEPAFLEILVTEHPDRSSVSITVSLKRDGSEHESSTKAVGVLIEHLARRKELTSLD